MGAIDWLVNGLIVVGVFYATKTLVGNEIQTLLTKEA